MTVQFSIFFPTELPVNCLFLKALSHATASVAMIKTVVIAVNTTDMKAALVIVSKVG